MPVPLPSDGVVRSLQKKTWWIMISSDQYQWSTRTPWLNIGSIHIQGDQQEVRTSGDQGRDCVAAQPFLLGRCPKCGGCSKGPCSSIFKHQSTPVEWTMSYHVLSFEGFNATLSLDIYGCMWFNLIKGPTHIKWPVKICVWLVFIYLFVWPKCLVLSQPKNMSQRFFCFFFPDNPGEKLPIPLNIWICLRTPPKKNKKCIPSSSLQVMDFPLGKIKKLISKSRGKNAEKQCYNVYCTMWGPQDS